MNNYFTIEYYGYNELTKEKFKSIQNCVDWCEAKKVPLYLVSCTESDLVDGDFEFIGSCNLEEAQQYETLNF